jgi:hypothetical protein
MPKPENRAAPGRGFAAWRHARLVLHHAGDVALGIAEEGQAAHGLDQEGRHDRRAARRLDAAQDAVHVVDREGQLHLGHDVAADAATALQGAHERPAGAAGLVEARRPPRIERPAEGLFVEGPGAADIVGVQREMANGRGQDPDLVRMEAA